MKRKYKAKIKKIERQALELISDTRFLYLASEKIGALGVAGEERNRLILLIAGIGRALPEPSLIVKGSPSGGILVSYPALNPFSTTILNSEPKQIGSTRLLARRR